jgi:hypothetical protein
MKNLTLVMLALAVCSACKKTTSNDVPVDAALKSDFSYKPGSYWIYKDSVSGNVDSAYVVSNTSEYHEHGCVLRNGAPKYEYINISINLADGNAADTERWNIGLTEKKCSAGFSNNHDRIESTLGLQLFTYPIIKGEVPNGNGCVLTVDSGSISDVFPSATVNSHSYTNVAQCPHAARSVSPATAYYDCFYISPQAGLVKIVFNHPADSVYRVLELMRYKIVK